MEGVRGVRVLSTHHRLRILHTRLASSIPQKQPCEFAEFLY